MRVVIYSELYGDIQEKSVYTRIPAKRNELSWTPLKQSVQAEEFDSRLAS